MVDRKAQRHLAALGGFHDVGAMDARGLKDREDVARSARRIPLAGMCRRIRALSNVMT